MKQQNVYTEVHIDTLAPEQRKNIIQSRWVLRNKGTEVRARIVAKGFTEPVTDIDNIYASTPIYSVLRLLLTISMNNNWTVRTGDISVAFLHAAAATDDLYMHPPTEFYNESDGIVWKLNKAIYGLRSSPKAWQTHLADVLQQLGLQRSTAEPNIYYTQQRSTYILVYVDDLLLLGDEEVTNKIFAAIQQHLLLRPTGTLTVGNTVSFLGRNITNKGDYYELGLSDSYNNTLLEEAGMESCKAATAPGTSALKTPTADHDQQLSEEEHKAFRRAVGKLQWMTYTRPDICYATKELARALQQPTSADQQKLKHLLRYIKGTTHYKQVMRPTVKLTQTTYDLNIYVDSDWAGCAETRKSTTGFSITFLGATITYGSRTQATIALSSAEAELYAINTGATEALHSKFTYRLTEQQQSKHQDTHRLIERQKHCNKDWNREENKTRRIEASIYTTTSSTQSLAHYQNTHQRQSCRYIHQVRYSRNTATSPTQCWTAHPTLSTLKLLMKQRTRFHKLL